MEEEVAPEWNSIEVCVFFNLVIVIRTVVKFDYRQYIQLHGPTPSVLQHQA